MNQASEQFKTMAARLKRGDIGAGEEAFTYFSPLLYRFFLARLTHRTIAEDLTQDVFFKIIAKIDTFDEEKGNFPGWIWQIARNTLIDHYRDKKEIAFADAGEGIEEIASAVDDVDQRMRVQNIMLAVHQLSEEEQELFSLRYVSDVSYKDMSGMLGRSESALRVAVHRLNIKVKDIIIES
ncbi:MAG: RNA polymerase, sigma-24 subunit, ECF subfamily [Candidatus Wolfebacteria bacterium GW2011_GWC2_46_275]|nr:MAG: RNA polymerase, sigma-24 subunit, ECF subfamily [Candidatus Wolfebacteria bacterium GW2011_GWC2_46_275]KKU42509.1 MAG: RNA polymerase, sigma-24 subunit, ECF subfamily [Candidatus Wolfebacteria bacterium GW2011_GWB2_46_69]KKU53886.1 MAG: RNA polymerase, sigma-24 subunit, ECF subfamily [Candidatus Wolfebacteria bacterium GW2011_GWC1_47_103]KKU59662.1 MAG: RNA polymerase, sigma-24 subunit, ECF subfamily [Candidatus Wolfebacteria bacterium GW2011_GWE2_47_12]KKU66306.1 MAG: RNA polymerase, s